MWDLDDGICRSRSRTLNGNVRSLAVSCTHLAVSITNWGPVDDNRIKLWHADPTQPGRFDLQQLPHSYLTGHTSPVVTVDMADGLLYSGSWDYTCRVWGPGGENGDTRNAWVQLDTCTYPDWVWYVAARGPYLFASASRQVHIQDRATLAPIRTLTNIHDSNHIAIEASRDGKILFTTSGDDGLVMFHDVRMQHSPFSTAYMPAGIDALAYDDPWLACGDVEGRI